MRSVRIGILGAGNVGSCLARRLLEDSDAIARKTGVSLDLTRVAVRRLDRQRGVHLSDTILTTDALSVVESDEVDLVVEVIGGQEPAGELVLGALGAGKPVVTANKALVAKRGPELLVAAESAGVPLLFEAAVGGGIPIVRVLSETLAGEPVTRVVGIINGTTNFMLSGMADSGTSYQEALAAAQALGYAEVDPTADVGGADAAAKSVILASLAFGTWIGFDDVYFEGIDHITAADMRWAAELGCVLKLVAIAARTDAGVSVRVHPAMLPLSHPLSTIHGATNGISIEGASVGELLLAGPGAGGEPTASALLGDVVDAARNILTGARVTPRIQMSSGKLVDFGSVATKWCVRLEVDDKPGVLGKIAGLFGENSVSIKSVMQDGWGRGATLIIVTHLAAEYKQAAAVEAVRALAGVRSVASVIRVEGSEV